MLTADAIYQEEAYCSVGRSPKPNQVFLDNLKNLDQQLYPDWHPQAGAAQEGRWVIRRRPDVTSQPCRSHPIIFVAEMYDTGEPHPFDNRVVQGLREMDAWSNYGSPAKMIRAIEDSEKEAKEKETRKRKGNSFDAAKEIAKRLRSDYYGFKTMPLDVGISKSTVKEVGRFNKKTGEMEWESRDGK